MDYYKIYRCLIDRAQNRDIEGYYETHHIIPRCLGGDDSKNNLVKLTPEGITLSIPVVAQRFE